MARKPVPARSDTTGFGRWYQEAARANKLDPDPDNPLHFYDYRSAFRAGVSPDSTGHWPSEFKKLGHPRLIINGQDTRTGEKASEALKKRNAEENARVSRKAR